MITAPAGYSREIRRAYLKAFNAPSPVVDAYLRVGQYALDDIEGMTIGPATLESSGYGWLQSGVLQTVELMHMDSMDRYPVGPITTLGESETSANAVPWGGSGSATNF